MNASGALGNSTRSGKYAEPSLGDVHMDCLLDSILFAERASVLPDHTHILPTESSIFYSHAEKSVPVLLVVGGKRVLVQYDSLNADAHILAKSGSFFLIVAIKLDSLCMRSSLVIALRE
jgi:hypothetical protein